MAARSDPAASGEGSKVPPDGPGPPVNWRRLYVLVLGSLAVSIALLSLLSWIYR